ncbi:DUF2073 domain-containing protein [archaeon]|jgi:hypothetical protein|nr:DUF2073 domain-containing protein [archaeon]MBT6698504.1 DUF2073 domain-containing protein [archaeon]
MVTFQFVPYHDMQHLSSSKRIQKLISIVKNEKIVVMEGRLRKEEEAGLIEETMNSVSRAFPGIEIGVIYPESGKLQGFEKLKNNVVNLLLGDRQGFTVVGPASIVKKIVRNPGKLELFTEEAKGSKTTKRRRKK